MSRPSSKEKIMKVNEISICGRVLRLCGNAKGENDAFLASWAGRALASWRHHESVEEALELVAWLEKFRS